MDLVSGTRKVIVAMEHLTKNGDSKIHRVCRLPITGRRVVNLLITEMAVFEFKDDYMILIEIAEGVSLDKIRASTEGDFIISPELKTFWNKFNLLSIKLRVKILSFVFCFFWRF